MLMLRNGQSFEGHVVRLGVLTITLDFTLSLQNVAGKVTLPISAVLLAKRLPPLTAKEREERLELRRRRARQARERWVMTAPALARAGAGEQELTAEEREELRREEERRQIEEYKVLLTEFSPEDGWGPERLAEIRRRHFILGLPVTYPEWRFWQLFDQWSEAHTVVELYERSQKLERDRLLTLFPAEEGWGAGVKQKLEDKQQSGEELSKLEAQFLTEYSRWQEAVAAREAEQSAPTAPSPSLTPGGAPPPPPTTP